MCVCSGGAGGTEQAWALSLCPCVPVCVHTHSLVLQGWAHLQLHLHPAHVEGAAGLWGLRAPVGHSYMGVQVLLKALLRAGFPPDCDAHAPLARGASLGLEDELGHSHLYWAAPGLLQTHCLLPVRLLLGGSQ